MTGYDNKLNTLLTYLNIIAPAIEAVLTLIANLQDPESVLWNNISVGAMYIAAGLL